MSNSSLVEYKNLTKKYSRRTGTISKITIHHAAAVMSGKQIADFFATSKKAASANYCIGVKGDIALSVPEEYRAWTSSNWQNDNVAVTIEVSNSKAGGNWQISDASYSALIDLCVDICMRNGIGSVYYDGTPKATLTEHRMFKATQCPGDYIHNLLKSGKIARDINDRLGLDGVHCDGAVAYGLDFTPVFSAEYYGKRYPDLAAAGLTSFSELFQHFLQFGMSEARQACATFNPVAYRSKNDDLDREFGDDWEAYYKHYLICGKDEIAAGERGEFM